MRCCYIFLVSVLFSLQPFAQEATNLSLNNIAPPNSPAFVLMDLSPSNITVPDNIQAFALQTLSAYTGNDGGSGAGKNFALEFQPYWYAPREGMDFFKYHNFKSSKPSNAVRTAYDYDQYDIFGDIGKKASISIALTDGTFDVFETPRSYVSIGARTRLIKVLRRGDLKDIKDTYEAYKNTIVNSTEAQTAVANAKPGEGPNALYSLEIYKEVRKNLHSALTKKPLLAVDIACAYSQFLGNDIVYEDGEFGRFGVWLSTDLAFPISDSNMNYLHIYGVFRYLRDGINLNEDASALIITNAYDYGTKAELAFNKFSLAYEYIRREGETQAYRSLGNFRYALTNEFAITGGFGKNFTSAGNTIAIFGIQWGLDYEASVAAPKILGL